MAEICDVPEEQRYVLIIDGRRAGRLEYAWDGPVFVARHVVVEPSYRGRGLADTLAAHVLDRLRVDGVKLRAECPFVVGYLRRHPEYLDLVDGLQPQPDGVS